MTFFGQQPVYLWAEDYWAECRDPSHYVCRNIRGLVCQRTTNWRKRTFWLLRAMRWREDLVIMVSDFTDYPHPVIMFPHAAHCFWCGRREGMINPTGKRPYLFKYCDAVCQSQFTNYNAQLEESRVLHTTIIERCRKRAMRNLRRNRRRARRRKRVRQERARERRLYAML